jgi:hypothetical protein
MALRERNDQPGDAVCLNAIGRWGRDDNLGNRMIRGILKQNPTDPYALKASQNYLITRSVAYSAQQRSRQRTAVLYVSCHARQNAQNRAGAIAGRGHGIYRPGSPGTRPRPGTWRVHAAPRPSRRPSVLRAQVFLARRMKAVRAASRPAM